MHKQVRFQTSFRLAIIVAIVMTIFGWIAFTPTKAENSVIKLSNIQSVGGDIWRFEISPDNNWVVYNADHTTEGVMDLYSVPTDGSAPPTKLTEMLDSRSDVERIQISADSHWVVYTVYHGGNDLYSVPIDGSAPPTKLSIPLDYGGSVRDFYQISADSSRVIYVAHPDAQNIDELYSVPIDGSNPPTKLNTTLPSGGGVGNFQISADSSRVVYEADQDIVDVHELYSLPIDGSVPPIKLNTSLPGEGDVNGNFKISANSTRVIYHADQETNDIDELFSVPIDGSSSPVKISGPMASGGDVLWNFQISADSSQVVYGADQDTDNVAELYQVPINGSALPTKLNGPLTSGGNVDYFQISADSSHVVYRADQNIDMMDELYSVPLNGSTPPVKLNSTLPSEGDVTWNFQISEDSSRVVYVADQSTDEVFELYSVPLDGSLPPTKLNGTLVNPVFIDISANSSWVVFTADNTGLYSVPLDGSLPPIKLNDPLPTGGVISPWSSRISPDSSQVVYLTNEYTDYVVELFSVSINRSTSPIQLGLSQALVGDVLNSQISADSNRVVYIADQDIDGVNEIYSVPVNGWPLPTKLNTPLILGQEVREDFLISADSSQVVYLTDQDTDDVFELYSVPINGSTLPVKLNSPLVSGYGVFYGYQISPDSGRVVYQADQNNDYVLELYSVPIDGSAPPVQINTSMPSGHSLSSFQISADSQYVIYRADQDTVGLDELYSVPLDGSTPATKLNSTLPSGSEVVQFQISADGSQVVYSIKDSMMSYITELYSVPIEGGTAPIKLNDPLGPGGSLNAVFQISPDNGCVVYIADYDYMSNAELYSVPLDRSTPPVKLNDTLVTGGEVKDFQISADSTRVAYRADQEVQYVTELYSVPIDGSALPIKLNTTLTSGGDVLGYQISNDSSRVIYHADQETDEIGELYSVLVDGSAAPIKLNGSLVSDGKVHSFQISADSSQVVYRADQDAHWVNELYSVPIDAGAAPIKINGMLTSGGNVGYSKISSDNNWVIYQADQDTDEVYELYAYGESTLVLHTLYLPVIAVND
ncbi:MAG: hypothetical protein H6659_14035 [Ardenticatenaceae bacterium]|nr:hypothetical protein [Ardenticatenaceae bacterium]MCB8988590.1 hypothetical protein [Ardenticatenaceae bacterium]